MLYCKKINRLLCVFFFAFFSSAVLAANSSMLLKSAELKAQDDAYVLNADVDIKFSAAIEDAISKGFALNFIIEFQLASPKKYWFDDEIATVTQHVSLSYHALSRQFLLMRGEQQKSFVRLDEAIDDLSSISDLKVFNKSQLEKGEAYKASFLMRLDTKKLPKTLLGEGLVAEEWSMSTQRFEWQPTLFK
ncbi:MAG: DUF4390 domain-containing protein [Methylotenera sp.]|nr:DUF4390 domain-containing protein [Methylotenera sp.]